MGLIGASQLLWYLMTCLTVTVIAPPASAASTIVSINFLLSLLVRDLALLSMSLYCILLGTGLSPAVVLHNSKLLLLPLVFETHRFVHFPQLMTKRVRFIFPLLLYVYFKSAYTVRSDIKFNKEILFCFLSKTFSLCLLNILKLRICTEDRRTHVRQI